MIGKKNILRAAMVAALALAGAAHAQVAGTWYGGVGFTRISPNTSSGPLSAPSSPNTTVNVGADTQPTAFVGRMLTDHWAVEVPIGLGFKHDITGSGAIAGVGKIGSVRALPISVFAQYRFLEPEARFRPYAMLGVTYAHFYGAHGSTALNGVNPANPPGGNTSLSVDSKWGLAPGVGVVYMINDKWFVDAHYVRSFLKTTAHLSTGQSISTKLDPDVYTIGVGMRF